MRKRLQASPRRVGVASVRSTLAGVAEAGGICKRAKHPCRRRREEGLLASLIEGGGIFARK